MSATVSLPTTTLAKAVSVSDRAVKPTSTADFWPGRRLFVDGEVLGVIGPLPGGWYAVQRGLDGTSALPHSSGCTVYVARPDQLYSHDPQGRPDPAIPVSPWINVLTGSIWFARGDSVGGPRWWERQTTTHDIGALGVRTESSSPTSST